MPSPAVSQIVISYNHERYVEQCLDSIAKQTFDDLEVVIVDDCSTDRTVERIEAWLDHNTVGARLVVNERNLGVCASANIALRRCRGELVSFVSADDYYEPDRVERQFAFWRELENPRTVVFGNSRVVDVHGREIQVANPSGAPPADGRVFDRLVEGNFITAPTVLALRSALEEVEGFDESLAYEDYDMWLKLADRYEFRFLPDVVVNIRAVPESMSRSGAQTPAMDESRARLLLKWLGRDRRTDEVVLRRAWRNSLRALAADPPRGRRVLRDVCAAHPSVVRRLGVAASSLPGVGHALAATFAVTDRLRR